MTIEGGVIITRGATQFAVSGGRAIEIVPTVLAAASDGGATRREIIEAFAAPDREMVAKLIDDLVARSILVPAGSQPPADAIESSLDIFYWHFGQTASAAIGKMNEKPILVMGVNTISRRIAQSLGSLGVTNVEVVDFHILRNLRLYDSNGCLSPGEWPLPEPQVYEGWAEDLEIGDYGCLIATCDFGGAHLMREWNRFCVENHMHFLPVVLDGFTGTVGPLVVPGETACYECLRLRENANLDAPEVQRVGESGAAERQAVTGFHPAMASVLGELAAMEICKMYGGGIPWRPNRLIEVNLMEPILISRRVLKLPLCPVCSPAVKTSAVYLDKDSFVPGHQLNYHEFR